MLWLKKTYIYYLAIPWVRSKDSWAGSSAQGLTIKVLAGAAVIWGLESSWSLWGDWQNSIVELT